MTRAETPSGICFDYGQTLVEVSRPVAAIAAAGPRMVAELAAPACGWRGTPAGLALAFDETVDQLVDRGHQARPEREVDIELINQEALHRLLGTWLSPQASARVGAVLQRAWVAGVVPIEAACQVLSRLRTRGMRLGLCSNAPYPPALMGEQLERLGLSQYFDAVLFTSEIGWRKPDPRVFTEILRRLRQPASSTWFVGDDWTADIEGAQGVGMRAILAPGAKAPVPGAEQLNNWDDLLALVG